MKRATIWTLAIVIILAIGGVFWGVKMNKGNQQQNQYQTAMNEGKQLAQKKKYDEAANRFDQAYQLKQTTEAKAYGDQARKLDRADSDGIAGDYDQAMTQAKQAGQVDHGYQVMTKEAHNLYETLEDVQDNYEHEIKPLYEQGQTAAKHHDYSQAIDDYQRILKLPYINFKYYAHAKKQAKNALAQAKRQKAAQKDEQKADKSKEAKTGDSGKAGTTGAGKMGDHTVNGKTVDASQIAAIRKQVGKLGYEPTSWSPQDLIDLYRQAASRGHKSISTISKSDVEKFLKP